MIEGGICDHEAVCVFSRPKKRDDEYILVLVKHLQAPKSSLFFLKDFDPGEREKDFPATS